MNNKLPIKREISFFEKLKNFFRKLFGKNNIQIESNYQQEQINNENIEIDNQITKKTKDEFKNSIKTEVNDDYLKEMEQEKFIDYLENNPELLYDLSIDRLKQLEEYYKESIKRKEEELEKIKKAS